MQRIIRSGLALVLAALTMLACARSGLVVTEAWIRATPPGADATAFYFTLRNDTERAEVLVAVDTPAAHRVTIHETHHHAGTVSMRPRAEVAVEAGGTLRLAPGGLHVMLEDLERGLVERERVPLTLRFASGATVPVVAEVRPLGAQ